MCLLLLGWQRPPAIQISSVSWSHLHTCNNTHRRKTWVGQCSCENIVTRPVSFSEYLSEETISRCSEYFLTSYGRVSKTFFLNSHPRLRTDAVKGFLTPSLLVQWPTVWQLTSAANQCRSTISIIGFPQNLFSALAVQWAAPEVMPRLVAPPAFRRRAGTLFYLFSTLQPWVE